jgi:predicted ATP-dependent serine protease
MRGRYPQGYGRCPSCNAWDSLVETIERPAPTRNGTARVSSSGVAPLALADVQSAEYQRLQLPLEEFNRVLGGGMVPGSLVLLGANPASVNRLCCSRSVTWRPTIADPFSTSPVKSLPSR